jgi:hypothetical protein
MNCSSHTDIRSCRVDTTRQSIPDLRPVIIMVIASLMLGGCSTHLGYVPHDVYAPSFRPNVDAARPRYQEVKNWAFNVADGYDSRAIFNRQAVYGGALIATAATSALVGLAAFDPGSSAIIGLPIGTTFLSGVMVLYNNEQKAVIYGSASQTIRDLLIRSDCRMVTGRTEEVEAVCLHAEVSVVMRKVNNHITLLDPKNVADRLKGVASSIEAKVAVAAQKQDLAERAAGAAKRDPTDPQLQHAAEIAAEEAQKAAEEANKAQAENTVLSLAAEATDFSDLQRPPKLKELPSELQDLCEKPPVCQATA